MATRISEVLQHLRNTMLQQDGAGLSDGQLLGRFLEQRDEAAAAALVRRHGPMVWGVCRRILGNHEDAEDAFQATFLVLVRRAAAIVPREMVGNWLYGVAYQTALKARATLAKRRTREKQMEALPEIEVRQKHFPVELQDILDQELSRLPDKYRLAIVLCDLEGKTRTEAARQLGVPPGTLAARLTRGRALLAKRLMRHGLAVSGGTLTAALTEPAAPAAMVSSTIKAVTSVAAGQAAKTGVISVQVAALTEGMVKAMLVSKIKIVTEVLLALTVSAAGGLLYKTQAGAPADAPAIEQKKVDDARTAALKALERLGGSEQASDREAAIAALADYRRELKAAEETLQRRRASAVHALADRFKFRVPIEIGASEFHEDGRIDIVEVWGTRPRIEVGGQYLVRGKYVLPPGQRGTIHFYLTSEGRRGASKPVERDATEVEVAKVRLKKAEAIAAKHKANTRRWDSEVNRLEREVKRSVVDPQVLRETQNQHKIAKAEWAAAEADVEEKKLLLASAETRLAKEQGDGRVSDFHRWAVSQGTTTLDLQFTSLDKQKGEFTLIHGMTETGYFHLILTDPERYSHMFANVYFGTGNNVLRKK